MESEWRCLEALDVQGRWFTFTQVSLGVLVLQLLDLRCKVLIIITAHSKSKPSGYLRVATESAVVGTNKHKLDEHFQILFASSSRLINKCSVVQEDCLRGWHTQVKLLLCPQKISCAMMPHRNLSISRVLQRISLISSLIKWAEVSAVKRSHLLGRRRHQAR